MSGTSKPSNRDFSKMRPMSLASAVLTNGFDFADKATCKHTNTIEGEIEIDCICHGMLDIPLPRSVILTIEMCYDCGKVMRCDTADD